MKYSADSVFVKSILAVGSVGLGIHVLLADIDISASTNIVVDSGQTVTLAEKIVGEGGIEKSGGGVLVLSNAGNAFSGGVKVSAGVVRLDAGAAAGSGKIVLSGGCLQVNAPVGSVIANDIEQTVASSAVLVGEGSNPLSISILNDAVFSGRIDSSVDMRIRPHNNGNSTSGPSSTYLGPISVNGTLVYNCYGNVSFSNTVTATALENDGAWSATGLYHWHASGSQIGTYHIAIDSVVCHEENFAPDSILSFYWAGTWSANPTSLHTPNGELMLNGKSQAFRAIEGSELATSDVHSNIVSDKPATLTITGYKGTSSPTVSGGYCAINGNVSVVVNSTNYWNFYQDFRARASSMTGEFRIQKGYARITNGATFKNVLSFHVANTAVLFLYTEADDAFAGTSFFDEDAGGYVTMIPRLFNNTGRLNFSLGGDSQLYLQKAKASGVDTLRVASFAYNGVSKPCGTYDVTNFVREASGERQGCGTIVVLDEIDVTDEFDYYVPAGRTNTIFGVLKGVGSIRKRGPGGLVLANAENSFSGGLVVEEGVLAIGTAGAQGQGDLTVKGTGKLVLPASTAIQSQRLSVGGAWTLAIPGDSRLEVVKMLDLDTGAKYPNGTYGSSTSSAAIKTLADHFDGNGVLLRRGPGICVIIR